MILSSPVLTLFWIFVAAIFSEYVQLISDRGSFLDSLWGRSKCDSCKNEVPWYALIPFLGRFIAQGVCPFCGKKISWSYFWFELAFTGIWAVVLVLWADLLLVTPLITIILFLLYATSWLLMYEDAKNYSVPVSWLVMWCILFVASWFLLGAGLLYWLDLLLFACVLVLSLSVVLATRNKKFSDLSSLFGGADGIALIVFTLFLGFQKTTAILIMTIVSSGIYLLWQKRLKVGQRIPLLTVMLLWGFAALLL